MPLDPLKVKVKVNPNDPAPTELDVPWPLPGVATDAAGEAKWEHYRLYIIWLDTKVQEMWEAIELLERHSCGCGCQRIPVLTANQTAAQQKSGKGLGPDDGEGGGLE